ncbi:hypothetical protein [Bacillus thuringiensis]|uniref:hypothetical protein n=1 Tax=Bacillus thuringiensis TaxID=1428 RepID=UPI000BFE264D|nr:hypothetical protein [Bacillus thuringiensis]PGT89793.1 hypothetical protein COD17_08565 [Bacillus thuringiensis]
MYEKEIYNVGSDVLMHTLTLARNVLFFTRPDSLQREKGDEVKDWQASLYIQGITDAIHNVPRAIQVQDEDFLVREYQRLCLYMKDIDVKKVSDVNKTYFEVYGRRMERVLKPYVKEEG